jgi:hypothetical protein
MMDEQPGLEISEALVGRPVAVPNRPEWGTGKVLGVSIAQANGQRVHRVSVQFHVGHKTLQVPPARLVAPQAEPERAAGWLDSLAGRTLDDRLTHLPPAITEFLGTPAQRVVAFTPLYAYDESPETLIRWARRQANVADPLSHWSRDELLEAYRAFTLERDAAFRAAAAKLRVNEGPEALAAVLENMPPAERNRMRAALQQVI